MNKPCCSLCVPKDERWACSDPSCKCHLPTGIETQPQMLCKCPIHAPEKKWEADFDEKFTDITEAESGYYLLGNTRGPDIKSFIRQLLEEKAVEVEREFKEVVNTLRVESPNRKEEETASEFKRMVVAEVKARLLDALGTLKSAEAAAILRR